jgi:hypothetical protein
MKEYTTIAAIENYMLQDIADAYEPQVESWIAGIENVIDNLTGRNFKADTVATARLYDGDGTQDLLVDDCVAITVVEVGNDSYGSSFTAVGATGADRYFTYPANHTVRLVPIHKVTLNARTWTPGRQNARVTAKWGYSVAVPDDIAFAATVFVAGILNQQRQGGAEVKSEKIGNYQVTYADEGNDTWADFARAMSILDSYKKLNI